MKKNLEKLKLTWGLAGLALFGANANADTMGASTNRYGDIPRLNTFRLTEPKQAVRLTPPSPQLRKLILNGIATVPGQKQVQAFMKELPVAGDPAGAGTQRLLKLTEGERDRDIEVLQIDEKAGSVRVINCGTPMTLTLEKDGPKPSNPSPAASGMTAPLLPQ